MLCYIFRSKGQHSPEMVVSEQKKQTASLVTSEVTAFAVASRLAVARTV